MGFAPDDQPLHRLLDLRGGRLGARLLSARAHFRRIRRDRLGVDVGFQVAIVSRGENLFLQILDEYLIRTATRPHDVRNLLIRPELRNVVGHQRRPTEGLALGFVGLLPFGENFLLQFVVLGVHSFGE